jgi:hypothetical protein
LTITLINFKYSSFLKLKIMEKKFSSLGTQISRDEQKKVQGGTGGLFLGYEGCVAVLSAICANRGAAGWDINSCTAYYQQACAGQNVT